MKYFKPNEFQGWYEQLEPSLKTKLDKFREEWGDIVKVSPVGGAVGRNLGPDNQSKHNVDYWGEVLAVDLMPKGMILVEDMNRAMSVAKDCGFTGIGIYPFWLPQPGIHVDVRPGTRVAQWGAIPNREKGGQRYVSVEEALQAYRS